jgi:hypothetical protein
VTADPNDRFDLSRRTVIGLAAASAWAQRLPAVQLFGGVLLNRRAIHW